MNHFALVILFLVFSFSHALAEQKWKRLLSPSDQVTLGIGGKFITVPYAYLREVSPVILKKHGIVDLHKSYPSRLNFQYLYPSLAPPPDNCTFENKPCIGEAVKGYPAAPKGKKQFYVIYDVRSFGEQESSAERIDSLFYSAIAKSWRRTGHVKNRTDLGLIEVNVPEPGSDYTPIEPLDYRTHIICFQKHCNIFQQDDETGLEHRVLIHRDQIAHWREYLATRFEILNRFPLE